MVYTVYKGVCLGLGAVAADFHNATQIVHIKFTCIHSILLTNYQLGSR